MSGFHRWILHSTAVPWKFHERIHRAQQSESMHSLVKSHDAITNMPIFRYHSIISLCVICVTQIFWMCINDWINMNLQTINTIVLIYVKQIINYMHVMSEQYYISTTYAKKKNQLENKKYRTPWVLGVKNQTYKEN